MRTLIFLRGLRRLEAGVDWVLARAGYGRMYVRCSWCSPQRITGTKICRRVDQGKITDGICEKCHIDFMSEYGLEPEEYPRQLWQLSTSIKTLALASLLGTAGGIATMTTLSMFG